MRIKNIEDVESTADCLGVLNEHKPGKWKRKTKFKIKLGEESPSEVRVFSDGTETLCIIQTEKDGAFLVNYDLNELRPLIDKIQKLANKYFTHDYGQVYLNPWEMKIWLVGGDGGIIYSEKKPSDLAKELEMGLIEFDEICPGFELRIQEIKGTFIEGEYFPPLSEDDIMSDVDDYEDNSTDPCQNRMEWIQVAMAIDLCNFL